MELDNKVQNALKYLISSIKSINLSVYDEVRIVKCFKLINEKGIKYTQRDIRDYLQKLACRKSLETKILEISNAVYLSYAVDDQTEGNEHYDSDYRAELPNKWISAAISHR